MVSTETPPDVKREPPTEPGWYRAKWRYIACDTVSAPWSCVRVVRWKQPGRLVIDGAGGTGSFEPRELSEVAEWGESIDAVFAERDRLQAKAEQWDAVAEHVTMRDSPCDTAADVVAILHAQGSAMPKLHARAKTAEAERDRLATEVAALQCALTNAEADARILAHAYENDNRPPPDVVARAHAYRAGRPAAPEGGPT